ncbi:DEAD/DEAH box helicase [Bacillus sp. FJAT-47783]|uniref:DEAD/DEAH box helicase n=1 Tax=Bacillus sp. FJAT-47783 TaxID=2922712 RepID=UPI001FABFDCD|nr:DEAD/DEAH box helicase [Bacillus sp. FJAT-47783]
MNDLMGRHLFWDDVKCFFQDQVNEEIEIEKGVVKKKGQYHCARCGNHNPRFFASFHCARCGNECTYCRHCIMMGRVSECTKLVSLPIRKNEEPLTIKLNWDGTLSKGQEKASKQLIRTVDQNGQLLIWAVCGAGKTEILFHGIEKALQTGKYVCIATPRSDVVRELAPRLKHVFPKVELSVLYGGSEDRGKRSPLTISTTHQLLRYKESFDVMIIDEVDAFPYSVDETLQFAVQKARKQISSLIYLTATPSQTIKKTFTSSQIVKIPARYHGYPLPVPTFRWCGNWMKQIKKKQLPAVVTEWVQYHLQNDKQAFLFVPHIETLKVLIVMLKKINQQIEGVYAEDPNRKEKVERFRKGEIPIIVTTTILERGVTVKGANVAVLGADDNIFTESALVQISGRVGRSKDIPTGTITFFHYGKTNAMVEAKHHIQQMNHLAKKEGLLRT